MPTHVADRLTRDERIEIYKLSGEGYSTKEITRMFNGTRAGAAKVRIPGVERILAMPEAHRFVSKFRIDFLKSIEQIPISNKAVRLDDLEKIRQRLMHIVTNCYLDRGPKEISKFLMCTRRLIEITDLARNEMEQRPGVSIGIGLGQGDLNDLTDEQLKARRDEIIRRAAKAINSRAGGTDEISEGDEGSDSEQSSEILLASPEELRREELQNRIPEISDLRQQDGSDKGMPSV